MFKAGVGSMWGGLLRMSVVWVVWDVRKGFGLVGIQGIGLVRVLWDVRYGSGPGYVGCRIIDSCHLI